MKHVSAGIIICNNKLLIARRNHNKSLSGKWEFPGAKQEIGETMPECLKREIMEELKLEIRVGDFFMNSVYEYEHGEICLHVYYAYTDNPNKKIEEQLESFAINLGIAFQIRDDVLDEISSTESLGKAVGSDKKNGKITALSYMKLNEAQEQINKLTNLSIEAIQSILGEKAHVLVELAKYLIERDK